MADTRIPAVDEAALLLTLKEAALAAGREIMAIYEGRIDVTHKADTSPQTEADLRAEAVILAALEEAWPDIPVVAEESVEAGRVPAKLDDRFFLVDPLDGTKEFINRNGEFTVNIALVEDGVPIAGVVYAPAVGRLFLGGRTGGAREERVDPDGTVRDGKPIHTRPVPADGLTVVASRSHRGDTLDDYLKDLPVADLKPAGSSLKFCVVAAGEADLYPRFGPTMEWDTAAGHAVLLAADGAVTDTEGRPLTYGKPEFRNPFFIARGRPQT